MNALPPTSPPPKEEDATLLEEMLAEPDNFLARTGNRIIKVVLMVALIFRAYGRHALAGNQPWGTFDQVCIGGLALAGGLGVLLALLGWMQSPYAHEKLPQGYGTKSIIVRTFCTAFGAVLMWLGIWIYAHYRGRQDWGMLLVALFPLAWGGFIMFLSSLYRESRHRAITTYLNVLTFLFAFLLVPLLWPMLVVLTLLEPNWEQIAAENAGGGNRYAAGEERNE